MQGTETDNKELEKIRKEMAKWSAKLGSGLLAVTTEDMEKRNEAALQRLEEHREEARDKKAGEQD